MSDQEPSTEEWRALYKAAMAFRDLGCWEWLWDSDNFGVQDPETGVVGYCSVMGRVHEHYALGVYPGAEGYASFMRVEMSAGDVDPMEVGLGQHCLMASFEDRVLLRKPDLAVIKSLGLKFRGRNAWPLFRNVRPHRMPWYVNGAQARSLTVALQQALEVALEVRADPQQLRQPGDSTLLVRVPRQADGGLVWAEQRQLPPEAPVETVQPFPVDEVRLARLRKAKSQHGAWEVDHRYTPASIADDDGPYFPFFLGIAEAESGLLIGMEISPPWEWEARLGEFVLRTLEKAPALPQTIRVARQTVRTLLEDLATRLNIKLVSAEELPALEYFVVELQNRFGG